MASSARQAQLDQNAAKHAARQAELLKQLDCFANSDFYGFLDFLVTAVAVAAKSSLIVHVWPPPPGKRDPGQEIAANILFAAGVAAATAGAVVSTQVQFIPMAPGLVGFIVDQGGVLFGGQPFDFNRQLPFEEMLKKEIRKAFSEDRKKLAMKVATEHFGRLPTLDEMKQLCRMKWVKEETLRESVKGVKSIKKLPGNALDNIRIQQDIRRSMGYVPDSETLKFDGTERNGVLVMTPRADAPAKSGIGKFLVFLPLLLLL